MKQRTACLPTFFSQILGEAIAGQLPSHHSTSLSYPDLAKVAGAVKSRPFTSFPTGSSSLDVTSKVAFCFSLF